jgi:glycosyltransferase involved in cell wall biosynthesis
MPLLDRERRFVGPLGTRGKRRLLGASRALLVPSLVEETSSLVAMEALACGTPVIAHRIGALEEIIEHGRTGFLVDDEEQMASAIAEVRLLDPRACRSQALERFSVETMTARYLSIYRSLADS